MQHDLGSRDCWCNPTLLRICPVCEPDPPDSEGHDTLADALSVMAEAAEDGCWRCGGEGMVGAADSWEAEEEGLLILHADLVRGG